MPSRPTSTGDATKAARKADAVARAIHREIGADRVERAVREVDDAAEREDQRQAERDQQVIVIACAIIFSETYSIQAWFSGGLPCFLVKGDERLGAPDVEV
jgi:hypothetical protein